MTTEQLRTVIAIVAAACQAEGVTLCELVELRRQQGRYGSSHEWERRFARVCARARQGENPPSYPQIAAVLGTSHSTVHGAVKRAVEELSFST